jgi:hypothetical protein
LAQIYEDNGEVDKAFQVLLRGYQIDSTKESKRKCRRALIRLFTDDDDSHIITYCANLVQRVDQLDQENLELKTTNQALQNELDYSPGGKGFENARNDFYMLAKTTESAQPAQSTQTAETSV